MGENVGVNIVKTKSKTIEQHVALAQQLGLTATPMICLDDGQRISGDLDAHTLLEVLDESAPLEH